MFNQTIIRIIQGSNDAEVMVVDDDKIYEKIISVNKIANSFRELVVDTSKPKNINILDLHKQNIIHLIEFQNSTEYYVYFPERKIKCTYQNVGYSFVHPNSLFIIKVRDDKITTIDAYALKTFDNENPTSTQLFKYPMPNQLSGASMCLGTVDHTFTNCNDVILRVIEANYTHGSASYNFKMGKSLHKEEVYEEFQRRKNFDYSGLIPIGLTIEDLIKKYKGDANEL